MEFYNKIKDLTRATPNDSELGAAVRFLINRTESSKETKADSNQITIFQDLERYGNRS